MVQIVPFRGLRYHPDTAGTELSALTAPPYDVIPAELQQDLYKRSPYNVIRLILNQKESTDRPEGPNGYTRAGEFFTQWQASGILQPDANPGLYAYTQTFEENGQSITRKGFFALLKLEALGQERGVLPHERTLGGPKEDRFKLMQATQANLSPIFMIYNDPQFTLENAGLYNQGQAHWQTVSSEDEGPVEHRICPVTEPALLEKAKNLLAQQAILIADGHHRYETALSFKQAVRERLAKDPQHQHLAQLPDGELLSDYALIFLANQADLAGLRVYPTHRILLELPEGWSIDRLESRLLDCFEKVSDPSLADMVYVGSDPWQQNSYPWALRLKKPALVASLPPAMQNLDVAILDQVVFREVFGYSADQLKTEHILFFERDEAALQQRIEKGEFKSVFYMKTPPLDLIRQVCEEGHRMPQKSTYFYPKLLSGLVFASHCRFEGTEHSLSNTSNLTVQAVPSGLFQNSATVSV
ncbi:MAG: DUF1015 domain-containing protein [Candidatus Melainabacteria bacterium]|nr:DUF1015 domain-containing protein [Candidatus Melainabacteria bacterium]